MDYKKNFEVAFVVLEIIFFIVAFVAYDVIFVLLWAFLLFIPNAIGCILMVLYYSFFTHVGNDAIGEMCNYYFHGEDAIFLWIVCSFIISFLLFQIATFSVIFFSIYTMKKLYCYH